MSPASVGRGGLQARRAGSRNQDAGGKTSAPARLHGEGMAELRTQGFQNGGPVLRMERSFPTIIGPAGAAERDSSRHPTPRAARG
jgi:hypothetical protein